MSQLVKDRITGLSVPLRRAVKDEILQVVGDPGPNEADHAADAIEELFREAGWSPPEEAPRRVVELEKLGAKLLTDHEDTLRERDAMQAGLREVLGKLPALKLGQACWFNCGEAPAFDPWSDQTDPATHAPGCRYVELRKLAGMEG